MEFEDRLDELHRIANAIRRNETSYNCTFGMDTEDEGCPEGVLLGHLHRTVERRDGKKVPLAARCSICQLELKSLYKPCGDLLERHLVVAPCEMDATKKYAPSDFITVCPNCHAALHRFRPWIDKETHEVLLR